MFNRLEDPVQKGWVKRVGDGFSLKFGDLIHSHFVTLLLQKANSSP